jgi:hypothetical protein
MNAHQSTFLQRTSGVLLMALVSWAPAMLSVFSGVDSEKIARRATAIRVRSR